jgi:DNA-binding PadR family transcriptional regulator
MSLPNWFQNMHRLEDRGWVKGRYVRQDIPGGGVCKAREYKLTKKGEKALQEFDAFYDYFSRIIHS